MAMGMAGAMFFVMSLAMQGANDMLDYVEPQAYWQAQGVELSVKTLTGELGGQAAPGDISDLIKQLGDADYNTRETAQRRIAAMGAAVRDQVEQAAKSDDPEVATRAQAILEGMKARAEGKSVRRLMAIKGLGALKQKEALPVLRPLLQSKEPFVADYAAEAIAAIEGKPYKRPQATAGQMKSDLAILPANCAFVGQLRFPGGGKVDLDKAFAGIPAEMRGGVKKEDLIRQASQMVTQGAQIVGNIRAQALTIGVAEDVGDRSGFITVVGRGKYDPAIVRKLIMQEIRDRPVVDVEGVEVFRPNREVAILCPDESRFVLIARFSRQVVLPYEPVARAIKGKAKGVDSNANMAKLLESVDRTKPVWAVACITESYREAPFLAPFDTMTLEGNDKDGSLHLTLIAKGKDPETIKAGVEQFEQLRLDALREIKREVGRMPPLKPIADLIESVKIENAGNTVTVTGELKGGGSSLMVMPLMFLGMRTRPMPPQHLEMGDPVRVR